MRDVHSGGGVGVGLCIMEDYCAGGDRGMGLFEIEFYLCFPLKNRQLLAPNQVWK